MPSVITHPLHDGCGRTFADVAGTASVDGQIHPGHPGLRGESYEMGARHHALIPLPQPVGILGQHDDRSTLRCLIGRSPPRTTRARTTNMTTVNNTNNRSGTGESPPCATLTHGHPGRRAIRACARSARLRTRPYQRGRRRSHQILDAIHTPAQRFLTTSGCGPVTRHAVVLCDARHDFAASSPSLPDHHASRSRQD
jgi:hypothetical protein